MAAFLFPLRRLFELAHVLVRLTLSLLGREQKRQNPPREVSANFIPAVLCTVDSNCTDSCCRSGVSGVAEYAPYPKYPAAARESHWTPKTPNQEIHAGFARYLRSDGIYRFLSAGGNDRYGRIR